MFKIHRAFARALLTSTTRTAPRASRARVTQVLPAVPSSIRGFSHYTARFSPDPVNEEPIKEEPSAEEAKNIKEESIIEQIPQESIGDAAAAQENTEVEGESSSSVEHSSQEIAATQESTDAVPESSAAIPSSPLEAEDQAVAAVSETTDQIREPAQKDETTGQTREPRQPTAPGTSLYVANLYFEVTGFEVHEAFKKFGPIRSTRIITDDRGLSKGYGFVSFERKEDAEAAVNEMNGSNFKGRQLVVQVQQPRGKGGKQRDFEKRHPQLNEPSSTLFIGNLSYQMSDRDLSDLFKNIAGVLDVRVAIDRRSGQPRGFSHADFVDTASAVKAREALQNREFYGRPLNVNFAHKAKLQTPRSERS